MSICPIKKCELKMVCTYCLFLKFLPHSWQFMRQKWKYMNIPFLKARLGSTSGSIHHVVAWGATLGGSQNSPPIPPQQTHQSCGCKTCISLHCRCLWLPPAGLSKRWATQREVIGDSSGVSSGMGVSINFHWAPHLEKGQLKYAQGEWGMHCMVWLRSHLLTASLGSPLEQENV